MVLNKSGRQKISRALILLGGTVSVLSGNLIWAKDSPTAVSPALPALFINETALLRRGFDLRMGWLSVGWAVASCGIAAVALLLWTGAGSQAAWIPKLQLGFGVVIILIALMHAAPQFGVAAAAAGGAILVGGAMLSTPGGPLE